MLHPRLQRRSKGQDEATASLVRAGEEGENAFPEENRILDALVDPIGTLYKYAFAK